ncbi:SulP family inorganic anion transporter [Streptomyces sp. WMMC500]|uniref:SulP family inorganic anion transporter n=1 Tax=Streptomyces sp. WMMC500 TaxID=3015154 RepID=UPI00248ACCFE|nr:SulP family inorganic anion transporter [Streptomyces sp. WMMC500]WBB58264.1 SulP family inorganic anion transporter [Streptomyces sp. WMMC500]
MPAGRPTPLGSPSAERAKDPDHPEHDPGPSPETLPEQTADPGPAKPAERTAARRPFAADLSASVTVFLIAMPLSLGIALATGAPLQAGLLSAAVGGIVVGLISGAPLQVSGPAAGLTVVTADLIQQYGWRTTCAITALAGLAQLALGSIKVARAALAVSPAIVHGMLAGIGATIALAQLHVVLGGSPQSSPVDNTLALPGQLADLHLGAVSVSAVVVVVLLGWPWLRGRGTGPLRYVPGALAAIVLATGFASFTGLRLPRVDLPSWSSHALAGMPDGPALGLAAAVLTITLVASVESLLSAVAVDKLAAARGDERPLPRADLDRELRAQGAGNFVAGLLGGLPVTGVAVRSSANVAAGAVSRRSAVLHGVWLVLASLLLVGMLELIPLAALGALVMVVGIQMVKISHVRSVRRHREILVYAATVAGVVVLGVLEGVAVGIAVAVAVSLHRLSRTRVTLERRDGAAARGAAPGADGEGRGPAGDTYHVQVHGQLTFLAVPRLSRALAQVPPDATAQVELTGSFMDHAAYETLQEWRKAQAAHGGVAELTTAAGLRIAEPATAHHCHPWTPWRNHCCVPAPERHGPAHRLLSGISNFQRNTAPRVRDELARLAREGQRPTQLFLTCADSRVVTSMITSSGPGDLFTVRNVGNLVPLPDGTGDGTDAGGGADGGTGADRDGAADAALADAALPDDSVAAAIEFAVEVLKVESITVCGHSGCGAVQALLDEEAAHRDAGPAGGPPTPLRRWLRHGLPSLARAQAGGPRIACRPYADDAERVSLANVAQQLDHLRRHPCVRRRLADGTLSLHGMYFHVGEAQAYVLGAQGDFDAVRPGPAGRRKRSAPA